MKCFFLFFLFPYLLLAELNWQALNLPQQFAFSMEIDHEYLKLNETAKLIIKWQSPDDYQINIKKILDQLNKPANPLYYSLIIDVVHQNDESLVINLKPLIIGKILFSLLNVSFDKKLKESINVQTPIWTIQVDHLPVISTDSLTFASLIRLTPEFFFTISPNNREQLFDNPKRQLQEHEKILEALQTHAFPWLLVFVLLGLVGIIAFIYMTYNEWFKPKIKQDQKIWFDQQILLKLKNLQNQVNQTYISHSTFYHQLTQFVTYLFSLKSGQPTAHYTTQEWEAYPFYPPDFNKEEFLQFLNKADQVKFAHVTSSLDEKKYALKYIEKLIKEFNFLSNDSIINS